MADHFFQRGVTYNQLARLSEPTVWVVYVGLGATIDRTDVSWVKLVERLLGKYSHDTVSAGDVRTWVERHGPQRAATTAETLLKHAKGRYWLQALKQDIRDLLYGPRVLMAGSMLDALSEWAYSIASAGGAVLFVTPNYDEYLYQELSGLSSLGVRINPVQVMAARGSYELPKSWSQPGTVTCVHMHGYVPQSERGTKGVPALGEITYQLTSADTTKLLSKVFTRRNVLIVGSSLADGPLVDSLIKTAKESTGSTRFAVLPLQGAEWRDDDLVDGVNHGVRQLNTERLEALALEEIAPDYFGQIAQLLYESSDLLGSGSDLSKLELKGDKRRYDTRIGAWWANWEKVSCNPDSQRFHHRLLASALPHVKADIGAINDEGIKIEVWCRWKPNDERKLALWATSIGTWSDKELSRKGEISLTSNYMAVRVFCSGSPEIYFEPEESDSRWRAYFGFPVWHYGLTGRFIVGVVIIASVWPHRGDAKRGKKQTEGGGSITEENLKRIHVARLRIDDAAEFILSAGPLSREQRKQAISHFVHGAADLPDALLQVDRVLD